MTSWSSMCVGNLHAEFVAAFARRWRASMVEEIIAGHAR